MKPLPAAVCIPIVLALTACASPFRYDGLLRSADPFELRCAASSDCIDSLEPSGLPALRFAGSAGQAQRQLVATLGSYAEAQIQQVDPRRVKAVFTTPAGAMDEVEFNINESAGRIDFRSRSRSGPFDAGKNRSRMLEFSNRFAAGSRG